MPLIAKDEPTQASKVIASLTAKGVSKYKIAKKLCVSWNTIHNWSRAYFEPSPAMLSKLEQAASELTESS